MSRIVRGVRVPGSLVKYSQQHLRHIDRDGPEVVMIMLAPRGKTIDLSTGGLRRAELVSRGRVDSLLERGILSVPCSNFNLPPVELPKTPRVTMAPATRRSASAASSYSVTAPIETTRWPARCGSWPERCGSEVPSSR